MNTISKIYKSIIKGREVTGRMRAYSVLMAMDVKLVEKYGYSHKLLRGGLKNWPWRQTSEMAPVSQPHSQLKDLSVAKTGSEMTSRYGQSQNDQSTKKRAQRKDKGTKSTVTTAVNSLLNGPEPEIGFRTGRDVKYT